MTDAQVMKTNEEVVLKTPTVQTGFYWASEPVLYMQQQHVHGLRPVPQYFQQLLLLDYDAYEWVKENLRGITHIRVVCDGEITDQNMQEALAMSSDPDAEIVGEDWEINETAPEMLRVMLKISYTAGSFVALREEHTEALKQYFRQRFANEVEAEQRPNMETEKREQIAMDAIKLREDTLNSMVNTTPATPGSHRGRVLKNTGR